MWLLIALWIVVSVIVAGVVCRFFASQEIGVKPFNGNDDDQRPMGMGACA